MMDIRKWDHIKVGSHTIVFAKTSAQKRHGLQFVTQLPDKWLMMFSPMLAGNYFHTVNCLFSMDIIPLNDKNQILDVWTVGTNMKLIGPTPQSTTKVVEAPAGWAKKLGLKTGDNLLEAL